MKHYIIVKFSETVKEKEALYPEIEVLFKKGRKNRRYTPGILLSFRD